MNNKYKKILKVIVIICLLVLLLDVCILVFHPNNKKEIITTFDSINAFELSKNNIIAVGSNNKNNKSYEKAKITLYNKKYKKIWETLYKGKYNSSFFSVAKDNNNYIAVGSYEKNNQEHKNNIRSALIAKYDENGKLLLEKNFQVLENSKFTKIKVVEDGYIVVGQSIYENMTLGFSKEGGAFIIKYDKNLNEVWKKNYGGSKSGLYNDFIIMDDMIYVVGKDAARVGVISKYTLDGNLEKSVYYEYTDTLGFSEIISDDKSLFIVGSKKMKEDKDDYDTDALIVKYDLDLNKLSEKTYRGKGMERYNGIIMDSNSNLVLVGHTGEYDKKNSNTSENIFKYSGIVAKYNTNLKELWIKKYDKGEDEYFTDINLVEDNYLISGYSTNHNNYVSRLITYKKSGKLIGVK